MATQTQIEPAASLAEGNLPWWRAKTAHRWALVAILLLAAGLRLWHLGQGPPGLNPDEASLAWNAWSLLQTGKDQAGVSWPFFYSRCSGTNNPTQIIYLTIPFQAIGGLNATTTRLPAAVCGIVAVWLTYCIGRRLWGPGAGLAAAGMLAVNPWSIHLSRWGIDASPSPMFIAATLASLLWAGLPIGQGQARPWRALLAGLIAGLTSYGYWSTRAFIPLAVAAVILVGPWKALRNRRAILTVGAYLVGFMLLFGPLLYQHVVHPEGIGKRGGSQLIWNQPPPRPNVAGFITQRYLAHFGPSFLFFSGDSFPVISLSGWGEFHYYDLPLMVCGAAVALWMIRRSVIARLLLALVLIYPAGDVLAVHLDGNTPHALRSSPGIIPLVLLSAFGLVQIGHWLWPRRPRLAVAGAVTLVLAALGLTGGYMAELLGPYNLRSKVYHGYMVDLQEACHWLKPRWKNYDAVFCTIRRMNVPYISMLVHLGYDPRQWAKDVKASMLIGEVDHYVFFNKAGFLFKGGWEVVEEAHKTPGYRRALFILRDSDLAPGMREYFGLRLVYEVPGPVPEGETPLRLYEALLGTGRRSERPAPLRQSTDSIP